MKLLKEKIASFVPPFLSLASFGLVLFRPWAVFFVLPVFLFIIFLVIFFIFGRRLKSFSWRGNIWLSPVIFYSSSLALFFLLEAGWLPHLLAIGTSLFLGLFFVALYFYLREYEDELAIALENISTYLNNLSAFFYSASFFGFATFLQISVWLILPLSLLIFFFLSEQTLWLAKISWKTSWLFVIFLTLLLGETLLVFKFLPIHFLVAGAGVGILWYVLINLSRFYLLGCWSRKIAFRYFFIFLILEGGLLFATRWI
jgi:hypothetical protein